jgi:hypothetical protein
MAQNVQAAPVHEHPLLMELPLLRYSSVWSRGFGDLDIGG